MFDALFCLRVKAGIRVLDADEKPLRSLEVFNFSILRKVVRRDEGFDDLKLRFGDTGFFFDFLKGGIGRIEFAVYEALGKVPFSVFENEEDAILRIDD